VSTYRYDEVKQTELRIWLRNQLIVLALFFFGFCLAITAAFIFTPPLRDMLQANLNSVFGINTVQLWWFVTRAAGLIAYLLLWFSTVWGLAVPSKLVTPLLEQTYTFDFHQFISLLSIGFTVLHIIVLMVDQYLPFSIWQILIPFLTPYRPFWVGIGILSFYFILLVTVTFYLRSLISMSAFRAIHVLSLIGYLGATLHGLFAGTDGALPGMQIIYVGSGLVVALLTGYWLWMRSLQKREVEKTFRAATVR
jgi:sulfoxide reductase heme-binding subunit YedZ